jgi:hypothetical protein
VAFRSREQRLTIPLLVVSGVGDQAGQGVRPDGEVAEPVRDARPGELVYRLG